MQEG
jgi:hypothetical protein